MKFKSQELNRHLKQTLLPLYWVAGDEPLLKQETADQIREACRDRGFGEREVFDVDRSFDWQRFVNSVGNLSLFAEQKLLELRLQSAGLDDTGRQSLQDYLTQANPDFLVLVTSPRLEAATLNTKWFKAIEAASGFVPVWPLNVTELPQWLSRRLLQQGFRATPEALELLVARVEGNLLAAVQEIEKLKLLANPASGQTIDLDAATVMQLVADNSRYNAFTLIDAALAGDGPRVVKILQGLRDEDTQVLAIVGALNNELAQLLQFQTRVQQGESASAVVQSSRVMYQRKDLVGRALRRLPGPLLWRQMERLRLIDQAAKGLALANPWDELCSLLLTLSGVSAQSIVSASGNR